jgi:AraC-like DNA-binding protein
MKPTNVQVWRSADLYDAELLKGVYVRHSYPWHSHEELSLGLVLDGAIRLRTRTQVGVARPGSFVLINSDELHQGAAVDSLGWRCRTIHVMPSVVQAVVDEFAVFGSAPTPWFDSPSFEDDALAAAFIDLHRLTETIASPLDQQCRLARVIGRLITCHARKTSTLLGHGSEPGAVRRAKKFLDEHLSDKVTLEDLSKEADLPPFRLLRAFRRELGVTPHSYQIQARIRRVHGLIRTGIPLAEVAHDAGFADQAHMTRVYKNIMGGTPGQFRVAALAG